MTGGCSGRADYDFGDVGDQPIHLVAAYAPLVKLPELSRAIAGHLRMAGPGRQVVVDLALWRHGETADVGTVVGEAEKLLAGLRLRAAAAAAGSDRDDPRRDRRRSASAPIT